MHRAGHSREVAAACGQLAAEETQHYLDHLRAESLTSDIDAALAMIEEDDSADAAVTAGRRILAQMDDEW